MSEKSLSEPLLSSPLLSVRNLTVSFGSAVVVDDVSFDLDAGETVALVGPSGSGKSTIVSALLGLLPDTARVSGSIVLNGRELVDLDPRSWQDVRGAAIGIVPQDPFGWFNPVRRIDKQIAETVGAHAPDLSRKERDAAAIVLLDRVGIVGRRAAHSFPHQLSGGMRQRAAIAGAIAHQPPVLVADEPTSALDPTIQAQVIEVLRLLRDESRTMLLVSHDRGVVRDLADRTLDIRDGRLRDAVPASPVPEAKRRELPAPAQYAIRCSQLTKHFGPVHAVDDVTLAVRPGETMAVIGESGCGKTTLARLLAGLETPAAGSVEIGGEGLAGMSRLTRSRRVQFVFQDAGASLDPRFSVLDTVAEPLRAHGEWTAGGSDRVREAIALVGLSADLLQRRPSELSGGQQQRVALARALVLQPDVVVLDEPVSALDPESRDAVLSVLDQMQRERKVACIVVSHDLDVVRRVADSVAVMYLGRVVEIGSAADVFERPSMPYTLALLSAAGMTGEAMLVLGGEIADAADPPSGCRFRTRCWKATDLCATEQPALIDRGHNHPAACHYPE